MRARRLLPALLFLLAAACGPRERAVKLAVVVPLTGDLGTEGQGILRAVELAVEQANASGRFPYHLAVEPFDDRAEPEEAANVADLVIADQRTVAVIGPYSSGCALRAARVYAQGPIAMITPSATNPGVTRQQIEPGWQGPRVAFRVCPTDDVQGAFAAEFVFRRLRRRRVAILRDRSPYGDGLSTRFAEAFKALGGRVTSQEEVTESVKDFTPALTRIKSTAPDALFFAGVYTEAGLILRDLRGLGLKLPFIGGDGANTPGLFDVAGDAADGAYLSAVGLGAARLPAARRFADEYRRRWTELEEGMRPFDAYGYDAARVVLDALERVGHESRYDRVKLLEALARTEHEGVVGRTVFDEKGDSRNKTLRMIRARASDRSFQPVE